MLNVYSRCGDLQGIIDILKLKKEYGFTDLSEMVIGDIMRCLCVNSKYTQCIQTLNLWVNMNKDALTPRKPSLPMMGLKCAALGYLISCTDDRKRKIPL